MISTKALELEEQTRDEPKAQVPVRLAVSLMIRLREIAAAQRRSRMAIMQDAILEYIAKQPVPASSVNGDAD